MVVVAYDVRWPDLFETEAARLTVALAPLSLRLEHTGSTAVPGLAAKPVIDILAGASPGASFAELVGAIERAGYVHRGEQGIPGRAFFRRGEPRAYHLHLTTIGSAFWRDHLDFRDHLRAHTDARDAYAALKHELAARYPRDRESYIDHKGPFVAAALARARASAGSALG